MMTTLPLRPLSCTPVFALVSALVSAMSLAAALAILPLPAEAAGERGKSTTAQWSAMDNCSKASFKQFPDYTAAAAAQRDAFVRDCLRSGHLPPRNDVAPAPQ